MPMTHVTPESVGRLPAVLPIVLAAGRQTMDQDRTNWSAREYADALNRAVTVAGIRELAQEVNEKWGATGESGARVSDREPAALSS
jgi:hypothetical protein